MTLTNERAELLANYLKKDPDKASKLFDMDLEEALAKINADGYDFSEEELETFAQAMVDVSEKKEGEFEADELDDVSGGVAMATLATAFLVCQVIVTGAGHVKRWLERR